MLLPATVRPKECSASHVEETTSGRHGCLPMLLLQQKMRTSRKLQPWYLPAAAPKLGAAAAIGRESRAVPHGSASVASAREMGSLKTDTLAKPSLRSALCMGALA